MSTYSTLFTIAPAEDEGFAVNMVMVVEPQSTGAIRIEENETGPICLTVTGLTLRQHAQLRDVVQCNLAPECTKSADTLRAEVHERLSAWIETLVESESTDDPSAEEN